MFVVYDNTGRINQVIRHPADPKHGKFLDSVGYQWINTQVDAHPHSHYVDFTSFKVTPRPLMNISDSGVKITAGETVTFGNVPEGAKIYVDSKLAGTADGTDIELSFADQGVYRVAIRNFPFVDYGVEVHAS